MTRCASVCVSRTCCTGETDETARGLSGHDATWPDTATATSAA